MIVSFSLIQVEGLRSHVIGATFSSALIEDFRWSGPSFRVCALWSLCLSESGMRFVAV